MRNVVRGASGEDLASLTGRKKKNTTVTDAMKKVAAKCSVSIFQNETELIRAMRLEGVREQELIKVQLIMSVTGYKKLVSKGREAQRQDIDNFVRNALAETGLTRNTVLELTRAVALATGIAVDIPKDADAIKKVLIENRAYTVPPSLYLEELSTFEYACDIALKIEEDTSQLNAIVEPLVAAGVPEAQYCMGMHLINVTDEAGLEPKINTGVALLREAAEAGNVNASAALGDWHYKRGPSHWHSAWNWYTSFGALALNEERRENVGNILKQRVANRRILSLSFVLLLCFLLTIVLTTASAAVPALGWICGTVDILILVMAMIHFLFENPYGRYKTIPAAIFVVWSVYAASFLLLGG